MSCANPVRVLVTNLRLVKELEELALSLPGVPLILLKGGALLLTGAASMRTRPMEDLDLLVRGEDLPAVARALEGRGYAKRPATPADFVKDGLVFDLHTEIWYLTRAEEEGFRRRSRPIGLGEAEVLLPAAEDQLIYVTAHARVQRDPKPKQEADIKALRGQSIDEAFVRGELRRLGFERERALSGWPTCLRKFAYLRGGRFRAAYLWRTLFPGAEFLMNRYDLKAGWRVLVVRGLRPLLLTANLVVFARDFVARFMGGR